jgi:glycosyltransferase involved in cell wall biosynthesis
MKILIVCHSSIISLNQQLYVEMEKHPGVEILLIVPETWRDEYSKGFLTSKAHPDAHYEALRPPVSFSGHVSLHFYKKIPLDKIKKFQPDLIYMTQEPWSLACLQFRLLAKKLHIPFVFHIHQNIFKNLPPPFAQFEQAAIKDCLIAFGCSQDSLDILKKKGLTRPGYLVPHAVEVSKFYPGAEEERRQQWGVGGGSVVIGYLGRFVPEKGVDRIIEAAAPLIKEGRDVRVLCVGGGDEQPLLEEKARALGISERVHFPGGVKHDDAGFAMRTFDILVLPSRTWPNWKEQFGRVLVEAWACGIPCVGSDSGEIPHLIRATGGGLVFPEDDIPAFTDALRKLVVDPALREKLAKSGQEAALTRYTYPAVAAQIVGLFRSALNLPEPAPDAEQ